MFNLPRFTLISGTPETRVAFTRVLIERSSNLLAFSDFAEPVYNAAIVMLYDSEFMAFNPANPADLAKPLPFTTPHPTMTLGMWIDDHKAFMRRTLSPDIFGRIYLRMYRDRNWESLWPATIIRDFDHAPDIDPLINQYGSNSCLQVNVTNKNIPPTKTDRHRIIWIQGSTPKDQVDNLLHLLKSRSAA